MPGRSFQFPRSEGRFPVQVYPDAPKTGCRTAHHDLCVAGGPLSNRLVRPHCITSLAGHSGALR